jgi:hypothetical protein
LPGGDAECGDEISNGRNFVNEIDSVENCNETWKNIHVSPGLLTQYSMFSDPELDDSQKRSTIENDESGREETAEGNVEAKHEESLDEDGDNDEYWLVDSDEQLWIDEGNDEYASDEDTVNVVNLYRSLIVESGRPQHVIVVDGKKCESDEYGDQTGDEVSEFHDQSHRKDSSNHEDNHDDNHDDHHSVVPGAVHFPIPKIVVVKDFNENFLETQSGEESDYDEISDKASNAEFDGESCGDKKEECSDHVGKNDDESVETKSNGHGLDFDKNNQPGLKDEVKVKNIAKLQTKISQFWSISVDPKNSVVEFAGNLGEETAACTTCAHCSESLENFKTQLLNVIANQHEDQECLILGELEKTKLELRELQGEYEKLDNLCTDYRNYVDEYSENLKRKNDELRKVKLSSDIMETEIEWLRHALGITRNYAEF